MSYLNRFVRLQLFVALVAGTPVYAQGWTPLPDIPQGRGEQCVEPTPVMRRNHMEFLKHHRDDAVVAGIRTKRHSLKGCIDCHATKDESGAFLPVNESGQFCATCHEYAAVKMDCFQCHATTPGAGAAAKETSE